MRGTKYFPTQLETFRLCPLKYKCSRDPDIRDKHRKPTPQLYMGMCVHDALEAFFDINRVPMGDRTEERLDLLLRRAWAGANLPDWKRGKRLDERKKVFGEDRELEGSWGKQALNILHRYFMLADRTVVPFTAEQFHEARLASGTLIAGKIDRIDRDEDGSLHIIDYKTGKPPPFREDEEVAKHDLQLSTYAIVIRKKFRVPVSRCSLLFIAHDEERGFTPTDELLLEKAATIEETVKRIEAETEFAPTENNLCPWCEYKEICPLMKDREDPEPADLDDLPF